MENENNENMDVIELERGKYYEVPWRNGKVGIPYVAKIEGSDERYGFKRKFLKPVFVDRKNEEYLIDVKDMEIGAIYEVRYPRSWKHPDVRIYFQILQIDTESGKMTIEYLDKKNLVLSFKEMEEIKPNNEAKKEASTE